jgi:cephalosporin hydroxylase
VIPDVVDRAACVAEFGRWQYPILKHQADLDRYAHVIATTRPRVVVETGTRTGHSAQWFARQPGVETVVTIDVSHARVDQTAHRQNRGGRIEWLLGSSVDPAVTARVVELVAGRTCMVSLDSDHSTAHVQAEIRLYGPLVTTGCHLVVEDGILDWLDRATFRRHCRGQVGTPARAIKATLASDPTFARDTQVEGLTPVTMFPAGWWARQADGARR